MIDSFRDGFHAHATFVCCNLKKREGFNVPQYGNRWNGMEVTRDCFRHNQSLMGIILKEEMFGMEKG